MEQVWTLAQVALPAQDAQTMRQVAHVEGKCLTHAQWIEQVCAWQATFAAMASPEVALYFEDALACAAALWGAWHAGKTPVLLSDAQPHTLAHLPASVGARAGDLPGAVCATPSPDAVAAAAHWQPLDLQACQIVMFTSGSTGQPERIVKKLAQLDAEVRALQQAFAEVDQPDVQVVATVSHQHIYGLLFRVLWPLACGRLLSTQMLRYPEEVLHALQQSQPCVLVSSPAFLSRLPEHMPWQSVAHRLVRVFSSGGPLQAEAAAHVQQLLGISTTEVFGSSETGGIAYRQRAMHGEHWQLLPGVEVQVQPEGRLAVQSAHLPDPQTWWTTADSAGLSADGRSFVLQGRVDRIVKIAEKRVSLTAVEQALQALPWVQQARAVLLAGTPARTRMGVVVELSPAGWQQLQQLGRRAMGEALRLHLSAYVEHVALPRSWRYVVRMPVNAQSKTTQHDLLRLFNPSIPQPQWLQRDAEHAQAQLYVDPSLRVLEGHFPQGTLVPGVAQLQWVVHLAQQAFGLQPAFVRGEVLKFQQPILPGDTVQVQLHWQASAQRLQFALSSARGPHSSGKLLQEGA